MKRKIYIGLAVFALLIAGVALYGALVVSKRSPIQTTTFSNEGLDVKVVYCRPYKKGRLIFGEEKDGALQPYGKYWRLGANAATEITFSKNVTFGGKPVNAGTYRMYAIPGPATWTIALNSELGVYFAINEPDYNLDVIRVEVPVNNSPAETEQLTINFSNEGSLVNMDIVWDHILVNVPIAAQ